MRRNRRNRKILNKKGFTFIEAIVVVAIMGILSVVIGGLVSSATVSYMRQKEAASAKDLSTIITNMIMRELTSAKTIFLENGEIPTGTYYNEEENISYVMTNIPFDSTANNNKCKALYSASGVLMYRSTRTSNTVPYVTEDDTERRAFYGNYVVDIKYTAVKDGSGKFVTIKVFVDVYKDSIDEDKKNLKYDAPGTLVTFRESMAVTSSIVHSYVDDDTVNTFSDKGIDQWTGKYTDVINDTTEYSHLYYV